MLVLVERSDCGDVGAGAVELWLGQRGGAEEILGGDGLVGGDRRDAFEVELYSARERWGEDSKEQGEAEHPIHGRVGVEGTLRWPGEAGAVSPAGGRGQARR